MGIFGRKGGRSIKSEGPSTPIQRNVQILWPGFYEQSLTAGGKPKSPANMLAVAELTSKNLVLNASRWFDVIGDEVARDRFMSTFSEGALAARAEAGDNLGMVPDEMIDYLWAWNTRVHAGLQGFVENMQGTIVTATESYGDELPMNLWES